MIHIVKTKKGQFQVLTIANNGEVTNASEPLPKKALCYKNIRATMKQWNTDLVTVQDDTTIAASLWEFSSNTRLNAFLGTTEPKYIAGKNPKKKISN